MIFQHLLIFPHLVLPPLIRMQYRSCIPWKDSKQTIHHCSRLSKIGTLSDRIRQDFRTEQIKNWGKIDFLIAYVEFGNVCRQLFKRLFCLKITIQKIFCNLANCSLVRAVFASTLSSQHVHITHQFLSGFMIDFATCTAQHCTCTTR